MFEVDFSSSIIDDRHDSSLRFECLVVGSILFRLSCHKSNIAHITHRCYIKLAISLDIVDHFLIESSIATVRDDAFAVLKFSKFVPHFPTVANNNWHASIDDDIIWGMQICNSSIGIYHCHPRTVFITCFKVIQDFLGLLFIQLALDNLKNRTKTLIGVRSDFLQYFAMLVKCVLKKDTNAMTKHDRVAHFHHCCFQMQAKQGFGRLCIFNLGLIKLLQLFHAKTGSIDDFFGL
mmetsp:Transcript_9083/g.16484  ORF Transcript_9083/g.16484 Transcript_9083/m.16484 type:complete len:234 (-) Transcript_9083:31-732(-)